MELIKSKFNEIVSLFSGLKNLQVTVKGNAEMTLHTKNAPDCPKFKAEAIEDGATVDLTDILLVGAAVCAVVGAVELICDIFD